MSGPFSTVVLPAGDEAIRRAIASLTAGEIVALPTETVYGLAGDATNPIAAARIFEAKDRPHFDPLIVHLHSWAQLENIARIPAEDRSLIETLAARYWPGPLTLLLPKREIIPDLITAGSPLVAVRMPAHPVFREVLRAFDRPLAAPSANRFGRISPTEAGHVLASLGGRIPLILDGGPCQFGLESTILQVVAGQLQILRDGPLPREELATLAEVLDGRSAAAPGQLASHYAPGKPLTLVASAAQIPENQRASSGLLAFQENPGGFGAVELLSATGDLREAAARLFGCLHRLDAAPVCRLFAENIPPTGLGRAIMDRLTRASARRED